MPPQALDDVVSGLQETTEEEEEEMLKLEEEVQKMAEKILEYRTTLPGQFSSTLSSLMVSQRPVSTTRLPEEGPEPESQMLPGPGSDESLSRGFRMVVESSSVALFVAESEKMQLLNQKISSNALMLPIVLKRMEEYIARIDRLASSNGIIIHPAFIRRWTS